MQISLGLLINLKVCGKWANVVVNLVFEVQRK